MKPSRRSQFLRFTVFQGAPWRKPLSIGVLLCGLQILVCPSARSEVFDKETIGHWEELIERYADGRRASGVDGYTEPFAYYLEHLADIPVADIGPAAMGEGRNNKARRESAKILFDLALSAYLLADPRYRELRARAAEVAEIFLQSDSEHDQSLGTTPHNDFAKYAAEAGEYELALEAMRGADQRREKYFAAFQSPKDLGAFDPLKDRTGDKIRLDIAEGLGDLATAEALLREKIDQAKVMAEKMRQMSGKAGKSSVGVDSVVYVSYPGLVSVLARQGKTDEANRYLAEYLEFLKEADKSKGNKSAVGYSFLNSDMGQASSNLLMAKAHLYLEKPDAALGYLEAALKFFDKSMDFSSSGRGVAAVPALARMQRDFEAVAVEIEVPALWKLGRFEELDVAISKLRGSQSSRPDHDPNVVSARRMALWSLLAQGREEQLKDEITKYSEDQIAMIEYIFRFAPERQRLSLLQTIDPFSLIVASGRDDLLFSAIIKLKGVVLDSVLEDRRELAAVHSEAAIRIREQLDQSRRRLAKSLTEGNVAEAEERKKEVDKLGVEFSALAPRKEEGRSALSVGVDDIRSKLSEGQAVLEYIRYHVMTEPGVTEPHYGVAIFKSGADPEWIPLGRSAEIDADISTFAGLMNPTRSGFDDEAIAAVLRSLDDRILAPLKEELTDVETLLVCPDAGLSGLSFSVLMDPEQQFACERWQLGYLSSSRDLLRPGDLPSDSGVLAVFADPDFAAVKASPSGAGMFGARSVVFDTESLPALSPLPGTRSEMESISEIARDMDYVVRQYAGEDAREDVLREWFDSPDILHFATHGLILPPNDAVSPLSSGESGGRDEAAQADVVSGSAGGGSTDNSLRRSMLALSGASSTFSEWKQRNAPDPWNDGLLSAEEVAGLNLENTSLAVLSACDTGSGKALGGEGVFGLRRGFLMAGVDHLLVTFWPIADEETVELMTGFYGKVGGGAHPAIALQQSQRESLSQWKEEFGLGTAVFLAGPFALSTSGVMP